ncbi:DinB family protein [Virgibacillus senegalensis]|uniref:DinB family protein n=1 Tax=Virgibacillus senegalensis TaxID=1499679 RepID=UPI0018FF0755|nr:DinB family protein [Virgibacillus senegalensis]
MKRKPRLVLRVEDLERSIAFYTSVLKWAREAEFLDGEILQLRIPSGDAAILTSNSKVDITEYTDVAFVEPKPGNRFYLMGEKVAVLQKRLEQMGLNNYETEIDPGFGQTIFISDPDGYIASYWEELHMPDEEIIDLYKNGPDKLEQSLAGLTEQSLDLRRAQGKWSIRQTVLHLIDSDLTTFNRMKYALAESGRDYTVNPYDPNQWVSGTEYGKRPIDTEVKLFRYLREHIISLCELLPDALDRSVRTEQGELTVRTMVKMVAGHAKGHIKQIEETRQVHNI